MLLRAEGPAFCSGYGLDWSTAAQASEDEGRDRVWDSMADLRMIGRFAEAFALLHTVSKPTIAAVHGWCIAGGTDFVLNADLIVAAESATLRLPAGAGVGHPRGAVGVGRPARARAGEAVPAHRRRDHGRGGGPDRAGSRVRPRRASCSTDASALAQRMAQLPLNQLQMLKLVCNDVAAQMYKPDTSRLLGCLFDGVARHTQEGLDFVARAQEVGFRQAVRERDDPFGDYGSRPRS